MRPSARSGFASIPHQRLPSASCGDPDPSCDPKRLHSSWHTAYRRRRLNPSGVHTSLLIHCFKISEVQSNDGMPVPELGAPTCISEHTIFAHCIPKHSKWSAQPSILSALMNASCGMSTLPNCRIFFLPAFCLSSSLRFRVASPP